MHHIIRHLGLYLAVQQKIVVKAGMNLEKTPPQRVANNKKDITHVLDLSQTRITELPFCSTLAKLKYLNLSHRFIERLPEEFWMPKKLRHLDLSVTKALEETLDNYSNLYKLRGTGIPWDHNKDVLKKLTNRHPLAKSTQHLSLRHCEQMQSIQISDFTHVVQLRELYVESCLDLIQLIVDPDKGSASYLEVLTLAKLPALQTILIGSSPHHFRNLLEITVSHYQKLHDISWVLKLDALEKLFIRHCHELEQVVQETINEVDNRRGWVEHSSIPRSGNGFSEEQEIHGMVEDANNDHVNKTENQWIKGTHHVDFPKLKTMVLTDLPKLTAICNPRDFPYLEIIRVEGCPRLTTLPLGSNV
ncbi:disease resistance protein RPS2-like [Panicum miliaceum]|uniref:Disease resistance protein RPS2-like n=1 Tax=Panicum miliaceum TaxID=4540 RepID=A0A3L6TGQ4_PANMI|nr:disease resistance protein RPS2-like [Panicum miliaceum]